MPRKGRLQEYYLPRIYDEDLRTSHACEPTDITIGTITDPNVTGAVIEKIIAPPCQVIDSEHPTLMKCMQITKMIIAMNSLSALIQITINR